MGKNDRPVLKDNFRKFLPPDAANYDDWDELFYDPNVLSRGLVIGEDSADALLFQTAHDERFAMLPKVNWAWSLHQSQTKTHREVHSLGGFWATTHRIWLLHALCFVAAFLTVC